MYPLLTTVFAAARRAHALGLFEGLLGPAARHEVIGALARGQEVHREGGEHLAGAALKEEDVVVVGHQSSSLTRLIASAWTAS